MAKYCTNCGKQLDDNAAICLNCGVLEKNNTTNTNVANNNIANEKKKGLPTWAIVLIVVGSVLLLPIIIIGIAYSSFASCIDKIESSFYAEKDHSSNLESKKGFREITYEEYEEKINNEERFVVVILNDGCGYCEMYEPIVKEVSYEYDLYINYINLAHLTTDEKRMLSNSNSYLRNKKWGTPTTLLLHGETVMDSIGGYVGKENLVSFLEDNSIIK